MCSIDCMRGTEWRAGAAAEVLVLNRHLVTSLSQASRTSLHGWNPEDWSMLLDKGFFLSKYEAQTFKNPVLK